VNETKELLRRGVGEFEPMPDAFDRVLARRDRKHRNQRIAAGVLGIAVFAIAAIGLVRLLGSEGTPASDPTPAPPTSGTMWPQSSLKEAEEAQRLADAGDPRYTWQVLGPGTFTDARQTEFITRFLQEELGWEEFDLSEFPGLYAGVPQDGIWVMLAVRCAPGQTNPLYPNDLEGRGCAPTIDEYRYETVMIGAEPPVRPDDPSAIWVVSRWALLQPSDVAPNYRDDNGPVVRRQVQQVVPPSDAEATALVEAFLQARVDGEGAEEYLSSAASQVPLLYATTSGAPYERSEFELVQGPVWPGGWREFTVRLFAAGASTVVEQPFLVERDEDGRPVLVYGTLDPFEGLFGMGDVLTRENGRGLVEPYEFLDGEVTFDAAWPWDWYVGGWGFTPTMTTLQFDNPDQSAGFRSTPRDRCRPPAGRDRLPTGSSSRRRRSAGPEHPVRPRPRGDRTGGGERRGDRGPSDGCGARHGSELLRGGAGAAGDDAERPRLARGLPGAREADAPVPARPPRGAFGPDPGRRDQRSGGGLRARDGGRGADLGVVRVPHAVMALIGGRRDRAAKRGPAALRGGTRMKAPGRIGLKPPTPRIHVAYASPTR
jgi:hypothetical protein